MAGLGHRLEYSAAWSAVKLAQALPSSWAHGMATGLGRFAHWLLASRRRIAADNLRRALGDSLSLDQQDKIVRQAFDNAARGLIEMARVPNYWRLGAEQVFSYDCQDRIEQIKQEGRGCIMVSAHYGGFEILAVWLASLGVKMNFLTGVQHNDMVNRLANQLRASVGVNILPVDKGVKQAFRVLRNGEFIALISDQHAPAGVIIDFFGRPAATPKGPASFAARCGCPILPFVAKRVGRDQFRIIAADPIYPDAKLSLDEAVLSMTRDYTSFFEKAIREDPGQWLWTHRRWKVDQ